MPNARGRDDPDNDRDRRITWNRSVQLRRAKATIWLTCEEIGAHASVIILNDLLRDALNRLPDDSE